MTKRVLIDLPDEDYDPNAVDEESKIARAGPRTQNDISSAAASSPNVVRRDTQNIGSVMDQ